MRIFWEVDVGPVSPSSTTPGCEEKRLEAMTVRRLAARDLEQVVRIFVEVDVVSAFSNSTTTGCEQSRSEMDVGLERRKERETFCGRLRKRMPFLRLRARLKQDARNLIQKQKTNTKGENKNEL